MSKRAELQSKIHSLADIEGILSAMKNLSMVEIAKLSRLYLTQQQLFLSLSLSLADFQYFHGLDAAGSPDQGGTLSILIGSERGFCGGFNEELRKKWETTAGAEGPAKLILVGRKLALRFPDDKRVLASLDGASSAEEIPRVISSLATALAHAPEATWRIVHHGGGAKDSSVECTSPLGFHKSASSSPHPFPPLLNLTPEDLRPRLFEQYLLALFYGAFYLSFMAENQARLRHMEGALRRIRESEQRLRQMSNALRQETITEEIEVIMLSVDNPADTDAS